MSLPGVLRTWVLLSLLQLSLIANAPAKANPPNSFSMSERQREILRQVMSPNGGFINKQLHTEFWQPVLLKYGKISNSELAAIKSVADATMGVALNYQRETWASVAASAREKKVAFTPGYAAARQAAETPTSGGLPVDLGALKRAVENGDRLVRAAASGESMNANGQTFYVTEELAKRVLEGLDGAIARAARLMAPEWSDSVARSEYRHDDLGLAILSDQPFNRSEETVQVQSKPMKIVQLSRDLNASEHIGIAVTKLAANLAASSAADVATRSGLKSLESIGAQQVGSTILSQFRGATSATVNGRAVADGQVVWISSRTLYRDGRAQMLQVMAIAPDLIKAIALREGAENDIRLLD